MDGGSRIDPAKLTPPGVSNGNIPGRQHHAQILRTAKMFCLNI
jgi:hypothetical protein